MSSQNPDPQDEKVTGLEPGGGVPPGETPPAEGSTGAAQGHDEHGPRKGFSAAWLIVTAAIVALALLFVVGYIAGLWD
jgi:hypothetical protein